MNRRALAVTLLAVAAAVIAAVLVLVERAPAEVSQRAGAVPGDLVQRRVTIGHSVRGRRIDAFELGDPAARKVLVVGSIHGDEAAGIAIARELADGDAPAGVDLWVIPNLNPDGLARGTRQNAHRVDLNRNFPWRWRTIGRPGDQQYSGKTPLSEPETLAARDLILKVRPEISLWYHQPVGVIDTSGGDVRIERRFSKMTGLPLKRLTRYPGGATNWQNDRFEGTTAMVVELKRGRLSQREVTRFVNASSEIGR